MRGEIDQLDACERAARRRSQEDPTVAPVVFYKPDTGDYGWELSLMPVGAEFITRFIAGRRYDLAAP